MGIDHTLALGALRLTLGRSTTQADVDYVVEILPDIVHKLRTTNPVYAPVT
jgi:cysteine desulfurase